MKVPQLQNLHRVKEIQFYLYLKIRLKKKVAQSEKKAEMRAVAQPEEVVEMTPVVQLTETVAEKPQAGMTMSQRRKKKIMA